MAAPLPSAPQGRRLVALGLAAILLAGCAGDPTPPTAPPPDPATVGLQVPRLVVGEWWNYTYVADGQPAGASTRFVAAETAEDYLFATDAAGTAFLDALEDISTMGPQRKADLAGSQGTVRVEFLKWPLRDGMRWTTTWDGLQVAITARQTGPSTVEMQALRPNGTLHARYVYDARAHHFSEMDFGGPDGSVQFAMRLAEHGTGYDGAMATWRLETVVSLAGALAQQTFTGETFTVPANATDVWVAYRLRCTQGPAGVGVAPAPFFETARGVGGVTTCPADQVFAGAAGAPQAAADGGAETWGWEVNGSPATDGEFSLLVLIRWLQRTPWVAPGG